MINHGMEMSKNRSEIDKAFKKCTPPDAPAISCHGKQQHDQMDAARHG